VIADIQAGPGRPPTISERGLYQAIWQRHTDRGPFSTEPISESQRAALEQAASSEHATLRMLTKPDAATVLGLAAKASVQLAGGKTMGRVARWIAAGNTDDKSCRCSGVGTKSGACAGSWDLAAASLPSPDPRRHTRVSAAGRSTPWRRGARLAPRVRLCNGPLLRRRAACRHHFCISDRAS
jgi:hypothetical protein